MTDRLSVARRSWNMGRIKGKDTKPELALRSALHRLGYRFRVHVKGLPGKPDIVLPKFRRVIFVHGCFWHRLKDFSPPDVKRPKEFYVARMANWRAGR